MLHQQMGPTHLRSVIMMIMHCQLYSIPKAHRRDQLSSNDGGIIHFTNPATRTWINTTFMLATIIQTCKFLDDCSIFSKQKAVLTHSAIVNPSCPSTVQTPANTEVISAVMGWQHLISHNSTKIWSIPTEIPNVHLVHQLDAYHFSQKAHVPNYLPNTLYM